MGILGWFMNRPAPFDTGRVSETMVRRATEKAIALTNPRLSVLSSCHARLAPAISTAIRYLRAMVDALPAAKAVSPTGWSSDPALRAFFVAPSDIPAALGRSDNVRTLFDKYPLVDEACVVLGMALNERRGLGLALHGEIVRRDVIQTSVGFSDQSGRTSVLRTIPSCATWSVCKPASTCLRRPCRRSARIGSKGRNWRGIVH